MRISTHELRLEVSWFRFPSRTMNSSTTLRRTCESPHDGAINVINIQRWSWRSDTRNLRPACQCSRCTCRHGSHQRYVDFVIHSLSTIYQLLFAGFQSEPAWEPRTVSNSEESEPSRDNWRRRDKVEDQPPITGLGSKLIPLYILYQPFHQILFAGATMIPASPPKKRLLFRYRLSRSYPQTPGPMPVGKNVHTISWLYRDHH